MRSLDKLVVVPRGWLKSPSAVLALRRSLRELRFDVTIDLQGLSKSAIAARLSGAPRRIGFDGDDGREISRWLNNELVEPTRTHVVDRNLELLAPLAIDRPLVRFDLVDSVTTTTAATRLLELMRLADRFAVINPGAGWPSKLWPVERFAAVAQQLGHAHEARSLVVWAGDQERNWAQEIAGGSDGLATLAPATSLVELAAIAQAREPVHRLRHGPLAPGRRRGHALRGLVRPLGGRTERTLRPATRHAAKNARHRFEPPTAQRGGRFDGCDLRRRRRGSLRANSRRGARRPAIGLTAGR